MQPESKWLWRKTSTEDYYEPFSVSYHLTLVTRELLQEEHIWLSLQHLFRKVPLLRTCFGDRNGETWLREMSSEIIDFEVVADVKADELHRRLHTYPYNKETGPLWCVKLRPEPHCLPDGIPRDEMPGFPHMYSLFFGINHAITDGTSNATICGYIVELLDEVLTGKNIDDEEQFSVFIPDEKTKTLIQKQKELVKADNELRCQLIEEYRSLQGKRSFVKTHLSGEEPEPHSILLTRDLDADKTSAFLKRCRAEGVTVNSAFTAIASLAMVDILVEEGILQESYSIRSDHVLNARRYWEGDTSKYLGCHLLPLMPVVVETPRDIGEGFWQYAKTMNEKLHKKITSGKPLQEEVVKELVRDGPDPGFQFEFFVTNMGEVTKILAKGGNHLHLVHMVRSAAIDNVPCPFLFFVHTFRKKFVLTLIYNKFYVTSELSNRFYERVYHHFDTKITEKEK